MDGIPELKHFYKQPAESFFIDANFEDVLTTGEDIILNSSDIVAEDKDGTDVTATVLDTSVKYILDATKLAVRVQNGSEAASPYKITFTIVTDLGNTWEVDVELRVEEV